MDRDLETICLKCLEKDPKRRYDSAEALADDLERYLRGEPILARRANVPERVVKWARRKPAIAALVALLLLVATTGLAGVVWQWGEARTQRDQAVAARNIARWPAPEAAAAVDPPGPRSGPGLESRATPTTATLARRGLQLAKDDDDDLQRLLRLSLAGWHHQVHPLLRHPRAPSPSLDRRVPTRWPSDADRRL